MMKRLMILAICGLLGVLLLAGCKAPEAAPPSSTSAVTQINPTEFQPETQTPISQIGTTEPEITEPVETAYPLPVDTTPTAYPEPTEPPPAYPAPGEAAQVATSTATEPAQGAYPAPTEASQAAYPNPTEPPAPYPGPNQQPGATNTAQVTSAAPTAPPGTSAPTSSQVPTNTPLPTIAPTPTVTPAPTASPTPELPPPIRDELLATDPEQFELVSGKVQLVEFFAYWCVHCRIMAPKVHSLEALYGSRMNFVYLDIDDPANVGSQRALGYRYQYQPQFFLLDANGKTLGQWIGLVNADELRSAIETALK